jgi:hypothetical protein
LRFAPSFHIRWCQHRILSHFSFDLNQDCRIPYPADLVFLSSGRIATLYSRPEKVQNNQGLSRRPSSSGVELGRYFPVHFRRVGYLDSDSGTVTDLTVQLMDGADLSLGGGIVRRSQHQFGRGITSRPPKKVAAPTEVLTKALDDIRIILTTLDVSGAVEIAHPREIAERQAMREVWAEQDLFDHLWRHSFGCAGNGAGGFEDQKKSIDEPTDRSSAS